MEINPKISASTEIPEDMSMNNTRKSSSTKDASKDESKENASKPLDSAYLCLMTCICCGRDVTTVLDMEEESEFKCDDCWLDYDHGCDVDAECEECRELAIWLHARWEVFRRITEGELDGGEDNHKSATTEEDDEQLKDDVENKKSIQLDDSNGGGKNENS